MSRSLAQPVQKTITAYGQKFQIKPTVGRVLTCYEVLQDPLYLKQEQIQICLSILVRSKWKLRRLSVQQQVKLFEQIFYEIVSDGEKPKAGQKYFDFLQDSKYIFAGFMQCYGIDLIQQRDKLHWWKFMSLFSGLSSNTRIAEIIGIRAAPIPKATKYNAKERANLIKLKMEYRLQVSDEERQANLQQGLSKMVMALEGMIRKK